MIELRRLRAVLLLSLVSAVGWAILAMLAILVGRLINGAPLLSGPLLAPLLIFAFLGVVAGAFFTLGLGIASSRGERSASRLRGTIFGALGGVIASAATYTSGFLVIGAPQFVNYLIPALGFGTVGSVIGFVICHVAARKELPASMDHKSLPTG